MTFAVPATDQPSQTTKLKRGVYHSLIPGLLLFGYSKKYSGAFNQSGILKHHHQYLMESAGSSNLSYWARQRKKTPSDQEQQRVTGKHESVSMLLSILTGWPI